MQTEALNASHGLTVEVLAHPITVVTSITAVTPNILYGKVIL